MTAVPILHLDLDAGKPVSVSKKNPLPMALASPVIDCSFARSGPGLVDDDKVEQLGSTPAGMTMGQQYSTLNIDTGTNPGTEVLVRSIESFTGAHSARFRISRSQHIVNQHIVTMLADLVGENVPYMVDETGLRISVTLPQGHGFNSENIGQAMMLGGVLGAALSHPGRYTLVAIDGNVLTFSPVFECTWSRSTTTATISFQGGAPIFSLNEAATVSASSDEAAIVNGAVTLLTQGNANNLATSTFTCLNAGGTSGSLLLTMTGKAWTPGASGTLTVYGWSYIAYIRNGTTATAVWKDTQRRGWSSGAANATKTSDLAPLGVVDQFYGDCQLEAFSDATPASQSTGLHFNQRATAIDSLPPRETPLYFFMSVHNGVTAPASSTRVSLGFFRVFDIGINKVQVAGFDQSGYPSILDVRVSSSATINTTITSSSPTLQTETETTLGSGATFTGTSRDGGSTAANRTFVARFFADQAGTCRVEHSTNGTTWRRATADLALAANGVVEVSLPITVRYHRCILVNGGTAQGAVLVSSAYHRV